MNNNTIMNNKNINQNYTNLTEITSEIKRNEEIHIYEENAFEERKIKKEKIHNNKHLAKNIVKDT